MPTLSSLKGKMAGGASSVASAFTADEIIFFQLQSQVLQVYLQVYRLRLGTGNQGHLLIF